MSQQGSSTIRIRTARPSYLIDNDMFQQKIRSVSMYLRKGGLMSVQEQEIKAQLEKIKKKDQLNQQMIQGKSELISFYDSPYKAFTIDVQNKPFPLTIKVTSKDIKTVVFISTKEMKPVKTNCQAKHFVSGIRLIVVDAIFINKATKLYLGFSVNEAQRGLLSIINVEMYFSHRATSSKSLTQLKNVRSNRAKKQRMEELDEFLKDNRHLAKQIIAERVVKSRLNFVQFNRTNVSSPSREEIMLRTASSKSRWQAQLDKSKIIQFEKDKQHYLNHISKMDNEFPEKLKESRRLYEQSKASKVKSLAIFINLFTFLNIIHGKCEDFAAIFYKKLRIDNLCRVFVRKLKNRVRRKMLLISKIKLSLKIGNTFTALLVKENAQNQAIKMLSRIFHSQLMTQMKQNLRISCLNYTSSVKKIQSFIKARNQLRTKLFQDLQKRVAEQEGIENYDSVLQSKAKQKALRKKYLRTCTDKYREQKSNNTNPVLSFFRNKSVLPSMMIKMRDAQSPKK